MALSVSMTLKDNFGQDKSFDDLYVQVNSINGDKRGMLANVFIRLSADGRILKRESISFTPSVGDDDGNFIKQAYLYMKTLPEYSGASDV